MLSFERDIAIRVGSVALGAQRVNLAPNGFQIAQSQVNDGVANVGDFVHLAQFINDHVPNGLAGDFGSPDLADGIFYVVNQAFQAFCRDGTTGAGNAQARKDFLPVEFFTASITFHDEGVQEDGALNGGKAPLAFQAFAPSPYISLRVLPRVNDFGRK